MSEDIHKWVDGRYTLMFDEHTFFVWDNEKDDRMCALEVTEKLNEQQALISALKKENKQLKAENNTPLPYVETGLKFARAEKKISEQQATIRKLQDLCGESDAKNVKLRIENKRLQKELNDCEKFRYTTFKRMRDVLDE